MFYILLWKQAVPFQYCVKWQVHIFRMHCKEDWHWLLSEQTSPCDLSEKCKCFLFYFHNFSKCKYIITFECMFGICVQRLGITLNEGSEDQNEMLKHIFRHSYGYISENLFYRYKCFEKWFQIYFEITCIDYYSRPWRGRPGMTVFLFCFCFIS